MGKEKLTCKVCGTVYQLSRVVYSEVENGKIKFRQQNAKICKCNEKEILG